MFEKIICIDFDGVIHSYSSGWKGPGIIPDPPVPGAIEWLNKMILDPDLKPVIYSSRSKSDDGVNGMKMWLSKWGVDPDKLEFPTQKPAAFLTIDDRALTFTGIFPAFEQIKGFKPWNKLIEKRD